MIFYKTKFLLVLLAITQWACTEVRLVRPVEKVEPATTSPELSFCSSKSDTVRSLLKFLFVIDRSGSNKQRYELRPPYRPMPGTDPNGDRRFDSIIDFVRGFEQDPYVQWGLLNFNRNALRNRDKFEFSNDVKAFEEFVLDQKARTRRIDEFDTNYLDALTEMDQMIRADIEKGKSSNPILAANYVIFFISDGDPIVSQKYQSAEDILERIKLIEKIEKENPDLVEGIQLNSAYYFSNPVSPTARELLTKMAELGRGAFLEFSEGQSVNFNMFSLPIRVIKFLIRSFWIENTNTVWTTTVNDEGLQKASLLLDSDGDTLVDLLEHSLGSNPFLPDSDGNGIRDGVEYRFSGEESPCATKNCDPLMAYRPEICNSLRLPQPWETDSWDQSIIYPDTDGDYLNDCEETLLGSYIDDFDSNDDYVPDALAFKKRINLVADSNIGYLDRDHDGMNDYEEILRNTPVHIHNSQVEDLKYLKFTGKVVSSDSDQSCYTYELHNLVTLTQNDKYRVYVLENTEAFKEIRLMRSLEAFAQGDQLKIEPNDFN